LALLSQLEAMLALEGTQGLTLQQYQDKAVRDLLVAATQWQVRALLVVATLWQVQVLCCGSH